MYRLAIIFFVILFGWGCQKAPTDEQLKQLRKEIVRIFPYGSSALSQEEQVEQQKKQQEEIEALIQRENEKYDFSKLAFYQLRFFDIFQEIKESPTLENWAMPALHKLSKISADSSVIADYYLLTLKDSISYKEYKVLLDKSMDLLLNNAILGRNSLGLMEKMQELTDDQKVDLIQSLMPHITSKISEKSLSAIVTSVWAKLIIPGQEKLPQSVIENFRQKLIDAYQSLIEQGDLKHPVSTNENYRYLKSPYALGKLIGEKAPEIHFIWSSDDNLKVLSEIKGKVVVLDFWTTWCNPCISSFPNIRKLQERYKNYPVVFLGITSVQGRHTIRKDNKREFIFLKDKPEEEFRLMQDFIEEFNITWPVLFSQESVFNQEYGVRGVPHVTIIDPSGKVRYNELRPYDPPYLKAEKIDALLKEAGFSYPKQPMEKTNYDL